MCYGAKSKIYAIGFTRVVDINTASKNFVLLFTVSLFHCKYGIKTTNDHCET